MSVFAVSRVLAGTCRRATLLAIAMLVGGCGEHEGAGTPARVRTPVEELVARSAPDDRVAARLADEVGAPASAKQILFGDLHVHTTFSADAFLFSLPIMQGEGPHPVADACDFARYCSALDFWSINDHAESLTPRRWRETKEAIRQCNAVAGDPADPDVVAYLGWEWTQMGLTPADHYGHKNVIFRETAEDRVPRRPIHSASYAQRAMRRPQPLANRLGLPLLDWPNRQRYWNAYLFQRELRDVPDCEEGIDVRALPDRCLEGAATPEVLFEKLAQWGFDSLVVPHGTTWGIYTPRGSTWDKQLNARQHDPRRQRLIEVYSGHGNSEEYRSWRAVDLEEDGSMQCPPPQAGYEPCCWRAGEIIRKRCKSPESPECERRVEQARQAYLQAGPRGGRLTVPGATLVDWGDCESCPDCFNPAMNYRPGNSVQYIMALSRLDGSVRQRFEFGFIGSSDTHRARPGTGYKEVERLAMTDASGPRDRAWFERVNATEVREPLPDAYPYTPDSDEFLPYQVMDFERQASFFLTGGLVAVHAQGRSRDEIWDALERREVYATSGERILLWFDLINGATGPIAMGGETTLQAAPKFRVRAAGALEQLPGCPGFVASLLEPDRLESLCRGECYNPGERRTRIERIEVVRIRPRVAAKEPMEDLIHDPWKVFRCPPDREGCVVEFEDSDFISEPREMVYYVRAVQVPTPAINAGGLRCERAADGTCTTVDPCYGDYRTRTDDDCLSMNEERAWSSPIRVRPVTQ